MSEVWKDFVGLAHVSVPLTDDAEADMALAKSLIEKEYGPFPASRVKFERITNHGTAIYSEVMK